MRENRRKPLVLRAMVDGGLTTNVKDVEAITRGVPRRLQDVLWDILNAKSLQAQIFDAYQAGDHANVDGLINAPAPSAENTLGLKKPAIASRKDVARQILDAKGRYRFTSFLEASPAPRVSMDTDKLLQAGWRSVVTASLRSIQRAVPGPVLELRKLLAHHADELTLTNGDAKKIEASHVRFEDTLFAFALGSDEALLQLAPPPKSQQAKTVAGKAKEAKEPQSAVMAQAEALLAHNAVYPALRLRMNVLAKAEALEAKVKGGTIAAAEALRKVELLLTEGETTFFNLMETVDCELAQRWLMNEMKANLDLVDEIRLDLGGEPRWNAGEEKPGSAIQKTISA